MTRPTMRPMYIVCCGHKESKGRDVNRRSKLKGKEKDCQDSHDLEAEHGFFEACPLLTLPCWSDVNKSCTVSLTSMLTVRPICG